eukprot:COSAG06_NODE_38891_length_418_cov_1.285266_1_plen_90_part_01
MQLGSGRPPRDAYGHWQRWLAGWQCRLSHSMLAAALGLALAATAAAERAKQPNILFILADVGSFTSHSSRAGQPHPRLVASPHLTQPAT